MKRYDVTIHKNPLCQIFCMSPIAGPFCPDQRPLLYLQVAANQEGIEMSGYLRFKKGRHGWKKSWFVLKDNVLYSYKASSVGSTVYDYNLSLICQYSGLILTPGSPSLKAFRGRPSTFTSRGVTKEWSRKNGCVPWVYDILEKYISIVKELKIKHFKLGEQMWRWNNQHVPSVGQRKNLSPRQDWNLWPPKYRADALSTKLQRTRVEPGHTPGSYLTLFFIYTYLYLTLSYWYFSCCRILKGFRSFGFRWFKHSFTCRRINFLAVEVESYLLRLL